MPAVWVPDEPRVFNLGLRERTIDHVAKTVILQLASDEAMLMDYATLVEDNGARAHEGSLRGLCNYVLARIGASLVADPPVDADVTAYWDVTNLMPNPNVRASVGNWVAGGANGTLTRATGLTGSPVPDITTYTHTTWAGNSGDGAGGAWAQAATVAPYLQVQEGKTYRLAAWARSNVAKTVRLAIQSYNSAGTVTSGGTLVTTKALPANVWTLVEGTVTTMAETSRLGPFLFADAGTQWVAGNTLDTLGWMVTEDLAPGAAFDGASTAPGYTYSFSGDANASRSMREAIVQRPPELFVWKPGVTAWDFLQPLLTPVNIRLFCDELRVWRLIDPAEYDVPGYVTVNPGNAPAGTDRITREDAEVYASGVVLTYLWEDDAGLPQVAYDVAGTPEKVVTFEYRRPFPGPGAAAAILARRSGTGRVQAVTTLANWSTTPGMYARITLPLSPEQDGKVSRVRFSLGDDALMDVGTRGLIDIPDGSWLDWDADEAWQDVGDSVTWASLP